ARRATKVAPLAAMRPHDASTARRMSRLRVVAGTAAVLLGTGGLVLGARSGSQSAGLLVGIFGGILTPVGVLWLGPVLVPPAARCRGRWSSGWSGRRGHRLPPSCRVPA